MCYRGGIDGTRVIDQCTRSRNGADGVPWRKAVVHGMLRRKSFAFLQVVGVNSLRTSVAALLLD
jgi:hypothetical protein